LGQLHALGVLEAYSALKDETLLAALKTATHEGTLLQALRLAEPRLAKSAELRTAVIALSESKSKALVFAAAIALGGTGNDAAATRALIQVYKLHAGDPWIAPAVLSSSKDRAIDMLSEQFAQMERFEPTAALGKLAGIAARANRKGYLQLVGQSMLQPGGVSAVSFLLGHLDGTSEVIIAELQVIAPKAVQHWTNELAQAAKNAANVRLEPEARVRAVQLLGFGSAATLLDSAQTLLQPNQPQAVQLAAVAALGRVTDAKAADLLLKHWAGFSPEVRKAALEVLAQRKEGVRKLLLAVQEQKVALAQIDATRTAQLKAYPDPAIRELAGKLFSGGANASRQKVIDDYKVALETKGDPAKGKAIFKKNCAACHKLENVGNDVGANLIAALGNKTPDALLIDILDPSREVDPRYLQYTLSTLDGRVLVGVVAGETASGVTLRIAEKGEVTILRSEIDKLTASGQSLMPAGLEQQVSKDDLAHLIAYLMTQREKK
jgi:putative heme-binding domain-containing protein